MINVKNQIPSVYYDASRDFQILGHLYEVVLNYNKTNADMLYLLPNGIEQDTRATELLALTLGFKLKRNYDKEQLAALVSIFPQLLKIKGTIKAVELAGNALVKASGISGSFSCTLEANILTVKIPQALTDITLFMDLLPYILPFGIRVSIIRTTVITKKLSSDLDATVVVRKAFADIDDYKDTATLQHPLGLAKTSTEIYTDENDVEYSKTSVEYSDTGFIANDNKVTATGLLGATPVISFDPSKNTTRTAIEKEED